MTRNSRLLRTPEAASYLGLSPSTLTKMRLRGDGPRFIKLGLRAVAYDLPDLNDYKSKGRRLSTSDPGEVA